MIAMLRGEMVIRDTGRAVLDVQGVGYAVYATERSLVEWSAEEGPLTVHVSTQVSDDAITLYGFATTAERDGFEALLGVSRVGPKVALSCLDGLPLSDLRRAIETDDVAALSKLKGIGKKTAQRLALELKGKLPVTFEPGSTRTATAPRPRGPDPLEAALSRLGYTKSEITAAQRGLAEAGVAEDAPVAERLRQALKHLYKS